MKEESPPFYGGELSIASLASSAFLIYLDPQHGTNTMRRLSLAQIMAATIGWIAYMISKI
ncbi:hypothetical protein QUA27_02620 [Microcoleus sp. Pol14C6]|uniref:hypothetical protein n=1 Tax=unclassified Microcoleus TaxID=2642155 RepID=UPI002FD56B65